MFFLVILAIFVCSFGVVSQATMYPSNSFDSTLFKNLIEKAYW